MWWRLDPESFTCPLDDLEALLDDRVALVALPHVSNLLGEIVDLRGRGRAPPTRRAPGWWPTAWPTRRTGPSTCAAWDVDWYVYSTYKVYGPHMAVLYGKADALAELTGPNHFFIPDDELPYKFEPGGANHESCAGLLALGEYLKFVAGAGADEPCDRAVVERAFARMAAFEEPLIERLLELPERPRRRARDRPGRRRPVASGHGQLRARPQESSREIAAAVDRTGIAIRHGHMYAWHLCDALGLDPDDGVVRVSFVHYNTLAEIERLIGVLDGVL